MTVTMARRSVHDIIEEWRAAERELPTDGSEPDEGLRERLEALRAEHMRAVEAQLEDEVDPLDELRGRRRFPEDGALA